MRIIDADELVEVLNALKDIQANCGDTFSVARAQGLMCASAVAEVAPTVNEWIPCSEELPNENKVVLACADDGEIVIGSLENIGNGHVICKTGDHFCLDYVVAWMPLPETYKGDEDK